MKLIRILLLTLCLGGGAALTYVLWQNRAGSGARPTVAPAFQLAGKSTEIGDQLLTRLMPVNDLDEKELGDAIASRCYSSAESTGSGIYLNDLVRHLTVFAKKPFTYRVILVDWGDVPNACALPGGVILVTQGLLHVVRTESELAGVLGHEIGHVELGHCFEAVKFELLSRKVTTLPLGEIADMANNLLLRTAYSKTQENDADGYGYNLILETRYDPRGFGNAFKRLMEYDSTRVPEKESFNVVRDYFQSHPSTNLRYEKFSGRAIVWWDDHPDSLRYSGAINLKEKVSFYTRPEKSEWVPRTDPQSK